MAFAVGKKARKLVAGQGPRDATGRPYQNI